MILESLRATGETMTVRDFAINVFELLGIRKNLKDQASMRLELTTAEE